MKKVFRILAMLLSIVMIMCIMASCNNNTAPPAPAAPDAGAGNSAAPALKGKDIHNDPIKIASISISTAGPVNKLYQLAFEDQLYGYPNIIVDRKDAEYNPNRQITLIEEAITQGYDAILLEAMDPFALNDAVTAAEDAGIVVICLNAAMPTALHTMYMSGADYDAGWNSGKLLDDITRGQANRTAIVLDCPPSFKPAAYMGTGFQEYIATTDITELEAIGIENWSADNAQIAMSDMLTKYGPGEITMVYCANDDIVGGAINAIEAAGRTGEILVWGFQGQPTGFQGIVDGKVAGTMYVDTYGQYMSAFYTALYCISTGLNSRTAGYTETPVVHQPLLPCTRENVDNVMAVSRWYS